MAKCSSRAAVAIMTMLVVGALAAQPAPEHVVVESNTPRYAPGEILAADTRLSLAGGHFVVLIADNGATLRIEGPFTGLPRHDEPERIDVFAAIGRLIGRSAQRFAGLGGVRSTVEDTAAEGRPSPWLIDAGRSGGQCYVRGRQAEFWRADASAPAQIEIREVETAEAAVIQWAPEQDRATWPADLPLRDGSIYTLRQSGRLSSDTTLQVFSIEPGAADDPQAAATWLAARGCTAQARIALGALATN